MFQAFDFKVKEEKGKDSVPAYWVQAGCWFRVVRLGISVAALSKSKLLK